MRWKYGVSPHLGLLGVASLLLLVVPAPLSASVSGTGGRASADGYGGGVASTDEVATRAGQAALALGGNSVDAALAAAAVLAVRAPAAGGLGGGSAVVHLDGSTGRVDLVDGCVPLGALPAWSRAAALWGTPGFEDVLGQARKTATKPLATTLRAMQKAGAASLLQDPTGAAVAAALTRNHLALPQVATTPGRPASLRRDGFQLSGGVAAGTNVPSEATTSVVAADRWGSLTAVVSSMGVRGGIGGEIPGTGVTLGAPLPARCGSALPTIAVAEGPSFTSALAVAAAGGGRTRAAVVSRDPVAGVLDAHLGKGLGLQRSVRAQSSPVLAIELTGTNDVDVVTDGRHGGSAAVVHEQ